MADPLFIRGGNGVPLVGRLMSELVLEEVGGAIDIDIQPVAQGGGDLKSCELTQFAFLNSFVCTVVGERHACLGVDVQAPTLAPVFERLRANHGPHDDATLSTVLLLSKSDSLEPFGVGAVQGVAIGHEPFDFLEILFQVPSHSHD